MTTLLERRMISAETSRVFDPKVSCSAKCWYFKGGWKPIVASPSEFVIEVMKISSEWLPL